MRAEIEHRDPVRQVAHHPEIVRDEDVGDLLRGLQIRQQIEGSPPAPKHRAPRSARRTPPPWPAGKGPGDRHPLLEAAGQSARLLRQIAVGQLYAARQSDEGRRCIALPPRPASLVTALPISRRTVCDRLSAESGF
jgi:hypothetical protein